MSTSTSMAEQTVRKTFKYKLKPTLTQACLLDRTLMLCRHVYNAAVGEGREAWRLCGGSVTYYQQKVGLPEIKAPKPAYAPVYSQALQDVRLRLCRSIQTFVQRV